MAAVQGEPQGASRGFLRENAAQLAAAIASLKQLGSDDAKFFAGQLESVAKLFD
ncbi:MAG: hypothetical protein IID44_16480 [Planctomycetes bacterium]|nr:hypothetical protein [Planctomycetota bacterium]